MLSVRCYSECTYHIDSVAELLLEIITRPTQVIARDSNKAGQVELMTTDI